MSRTADPIAKLARIDADIASLRAKLDGLIDARQSLLTGLIAQGASVKSEVAAKVTAITHANTLAATGRNLTEAQVRNIRDLWSSGWTQSAIARKYGLSQPTIYKIVRRVSYADVA